MAQKVQFCSSVSLPSAVCGEPFNSQIFFIQTLTWNLYLVRRSVDQPTACRNGGPLYQEQEYSRFERNSWRVQHRGVL